MSDTPSLRPKSISSPFMRAAEVMARSNRTPGNVRQLGVSGNFFTVGEGGTLTESGVPVDESSS